MITEPSNALQCAACGTYTKVKPASKDTAFIHCHYCARDAGQLLEHIRKSGVILPATITRPEELGGLHTLAYRTWQTCPLSNRIVAAYKSGAVFDDTTTVLCRLALEILEPAITQFAADYSGHLDLVRTKMNFKVQRTMPDRSQLLLVASRTASNITIKNGTASLTLVGQSCEEFRFTLSQLETLLSNAQQVLESLART